MTAINTNTAPALSHSKLFSLTPNETALLVSPQTDLLNKYKLLRPEDVDRLCENEHKSVAMVEGFINARSVSGMFGDSGLGKSPLAYQSGLCVAAGIPFLNLATRQGLVVYADYENGIDEGRNLRNTLVKFLGLPKTPSDFILWSPEHGDRLDLQAICADLHPALLILDSLRLHDPAAEKTDHAPQLMQTLRSAASKYGTAIKFIHHTKKPANGEEMPPLEDAALMHWLNQAAGHRSLINQTDTRIAVHIPSSAGHAIAAANGGSAGEVALALRWHRRIHGESGPFYLARVLDEAGDPQGYRRLRGAELLFNSDQEKAFANLADKFTFADAKRAYGRTDKPTRDFLIKCEGLGISRQIARGSYAKLQEGK